MPVVRTPARTDRFKELHRLQFPTFDQGRPTMEKSHPDSAVPSPDARPAANVLVAKGPEHDSSPEPDGPAPKTACSDSSLHPAKFPIVGIGASAGGLESLEQFFDALPAVTGMAFVIVQHLSPDFKSVMDELLARHTKITIHRVTDGMQVEPDAIYLIPPRKEMIIAGGKLLLSDKDPTQGLTLPIDTFFRSLAQDAGSCGSGIILSGTGSDGSRGICDIHDSGGFVLAQDVDSAKFDGMPKSAVETGVVDAVLRPDQMPAALLSYVQHPNADALAWQLPADSLLLVGFVAFFLF